MYHTAKNGIEKTKFSNKPESLNNGDKPFFLRNVRRRY